MKAAYPLEILDQHVGIIGKTGSGKTYAAKGMVERMLQEGRRVCVLDPTGAWWGLKSSADGTAPGFPVVIFGGAHADIPINDQMGRALGEFIAQSSVPAIIDLSEMFTGESHRFVAGFAERPDDQHLQATTAGASHIGSVLQHGQGAMSPEELLNVWMQRFPPKTARMLQVLVEAHPDALTRAEIAERSEVSPTSSGLGGGLRDLLKNNLIDGRGGAYRANPFLTGSEMPDG